MINAILVIITLAIVVLIFEIERLIVITEHVNAQLAVILDGHALTVKSLRQVRRERSGKHQAELAEFMQERKEASGE